MDPFRSFIDTAIVQPAPAPKNGKKRCRNGDTPERCVKKRAKTAVDLDSLTPTQLTTLSEAASILQIPLKDLPTTLRNISHSLDSNGRRRIIPKKISKRRTETSPAMEEAPGASKQSPRTGIFWPGNILDPKPALQEKFSGTPDDSCSLSFLGAKRLPKQIADCFASLSPQISNPAYRARNQDGYPRPEMAYSDFDTPLLNDIHGPFLTSTEASLQPGNAEGLINSYGTDPTNFYACDYPTPRVDDFFASISKSPLAHFSQPFATHQSMIYPGDGYFDEHVDWDELLCPASSIQRENSDSSEPVSTSTDSEHKDQGHDPDDDGLTERLEIPRRKFHSEDARLKTAQTRKLTACIRCRMQRIRCDPDPTNPKGACLTCQRIMKPTMRNLPCLRYKVTEVRLFREGSFAAGREWSHRWVNNKLVNIKAWASPEIKELRITQDYGPSAITLQVREFVPMKGDMLHRQWADGPVTKSVTIPNFAILDMAVALQTYKEFIVSEGPHFFKSAVDYNDRLLWSTYSAAIKYSNISNAPEERDLLQMVLQLWVAIRLTTKSARIVGAETLGMTPEMMDKSSGMQGKIPVPPVLGAQLTLIATHSLQAPLRAKVLDRLQKLVLAQKPENWFCIYLCTFVLLHSCSLLVEHDIGYAKKHGLKSRHARPDLVSELYLGANILLAHFHYCCKGFRPFSINWNPNESTSMAKLNEEQILFIKETAVYADHNDTRFKKLLSEGPYENEHYLVAQLFEADWKPRTPV